MSQEGAYLLCQKVDVNGPENDESIQIQYIQDLSTIDTEKHSKILPDSVKKDINKYNKKYKGNKKYIKEKKEESNFIKIMILVIGIISILLGCYFFTTVTTRIGFFTYVLLPVIFGIICILFSVTNII